LSSPHPSPRSYILTELRAGDWVSGQTLCEALSISRAAISKHVAALRAAGYEIEAATRRGYCLQHEPDLLHRDAMAARLHTTTFGQAGWQHAMRVDSTNRLAREAALAGAPHGSIVVAEEQTAGRGRLGRSWASPPGTGIYASLICRPQLAPETMPLLTLLTAVSACEAITQTTGAVTTIKWPNDLLLNGGKLAGILTEMTGDADALSVVIIGIGINVNTPVAQLPVRPIYPATSLLAETGRRTERADLLAAFLERFEEWYGLLARGDAAAIVERWSELSGIIGQELSVQQVSGLIAGTVTAVDPSGALRLRDAAGNSRLVVSGDVLP
jgi:BirA family biotin operon repressor/biotin-[acetyl-CoA-carboxylase] ligase